MQLIFKLLIIIIFIPVSLLSNDNSNIAYVTTKSGVILRDSPSTSGNKIVVLSRNTRIEILDESKNIDKIENISSKWYKVRYYQIEGWVFGGFITNLINLTNAYINNRYDASLYNNDMHVITTIPYRSKVEILTTKSAFKVKWNNYEGWINDDESLSFLEIPKYVPNYKKENEPFYEKSREAYYFKIIKFFGNTKDEIISKIGKPKSLNKQEQQNKYDESAIDIIYTLKYDGLEISILRVAYDGREFITNFLFSSHNIVKNDKFLNAPISNVYKELGIPHKDMHSSVYYKLTESKYYGISFYQNNNVVNKIELKSYPD